MNFWLPQNLQWLSGIFFFSNVSVFASLSSFSGTQPMSRLPSLSWMSSFLCLPHLELLKLFGFTEAPLVSRGMSYSQTSSLEKKKKKKKKRKRVWYLKKTWHEAYEWYHCVCEGIQLSSPFCCVFRGMHCIYTWWDRTVETNPLISICENTQKIMGTSGPFSYLIILKE